jgi:hypothetical protein
MTIATFASVIAADFPIYTIKTARDALSAVKGPTRI